MIIANTAGISIDKAEGCTDCILPALCASWAVYVIIFRFFLDFLTMQAVATQENRRRSVPELTYWMLG